MRHRIFQVDAFATRLFAGNPAAVVVMERFPSDTTMQAVAAENNLAETAFLVRDGDDYQLRWFTPVVEVPLCGHATLASAAVVMERLDLTRTNVVFQTDSGPLTVLRAGDDYVMNFPSRPSEPTLARQDLADALGCVPRELFVNGFNYMAVLDNPRTVRSLSPDFEGLARLDRPGIIVTASGDGKYDFISRYFAPAKGIPEDPVTGAAHCMLAPYWATRLGKRAFTAFQASRRGGEVVCRVVGDRVELQGNCVFFLEGHVDF